MSVYEPIKIVKMTNMEVDIKVDKVANMVADREVDKVADMVAYLRGRHSFNQMFTILTILFFFCVCGNVYYGALGYRWLSRKCKISFIPHHQLLEEGCLHPDAGRRALRHCPA